MKFTFNLEMVSTFTGNPISGHCLWTTIYKYINVILDGLQGLMVSIAFCYRNGEVCFHSNLLKDKYSKIIELQKMCLTIKTNSIIQKTFRTVCFARSEICFAQVGNDFARIFLLKITERTCSSANSREVPRLASLKFRSRRSRTTIITTRRSPGKYSGRHLMGSRIIGSIG